MPLLLSLLILYYYFDWDHKSDHERIKHVCLKFTDSLMHSLWSDKHTSMKLSKSLWVNYISLSFKHTKRQTAPLMSNVYQQKSAKRHTSITTHNYRKYEKMWMGNHYMSIWLNLSTFHPPSLISLYLCVSLHLFSICCCWYPLWDHFSDVFHKSHVI